MRFPQSGGKQPNSFSSGVDADVGLSCELKFSAPQKQSFLEEQLLWFTAGRQDTKLPGGKPSGSSLTPTIQNVGFSVVLKGGVL